MWESSSAMWEWETERLCGKVGRDWKALECKISLQDAILQRASQCCNPPTIIIPNPFQNFKKSKYECQIWFSRNDNFSWVGENFSIFRVLQSPKKTCRTFDETMIREDGTVETDYYGVDTGLYARYAILDYCHKIGLKTSFQTSGPMVRALPQKPGA